MNNIYQHILEKYLKSEKTPRKAEYATGTDFVLAISGAAACGKTIFCQRMVEYLLSRNIAAVHVSLDGYLLDRETRNKKKLSGYDPEASDFHKMIHQMKRLIYEGEAVNLPVYDHKTGNHKQPHRIESARVVILDGIMSLEKEMRERFSNLNIFFTSDDIIIRGLRLMVDMEERGYSLFQALAHSDEEFIFYKKWIHPQIKYAHLKIRVGKDRALSIASD